MIAILRRLIVLFETVLQIFLRIGLKRDERNNMTDRIRDLEDAVDDKEANDIEKERDE